MRLRKNVANIDAFSRRFAGMPLLAEDFKFYVDTMAHYACEEGADAKMARRLFAEKLSSEPVVRVMSDYEDGGEEARTVFWEIAELCYRNTSMRDIWEKRAEDDGFSRLLDAIGNLRDKPGSVHMLLRVAAKSKGDAKIRKAGAPTAARFGTGEDEAARTLRNAG